MTEASQQSLHRAFNTELWLDKIHHLIIKNDVSFRNFVALKNMSFTLSLPLSDIFAGYIPDQTDLLRTLKYVFQSLDFGKNVKIVGSTLQITLQYADIFDEAADNLAYSGEDIPTGFLILGTDDRLKEDEKDEENEEEEDDDRNDTRMFMFVTLAKYFSSFFGYDTAPSDHLTIYLKYTDLKRYLVSEDRDVFDDQVREFMVSYGKNTPELFEKFLAIQLQS